MSRPDELYLNTLYLYGLHSHLLHLHWHRPDRLHGHLPHDLLHRLHLNWELLLNLNSLHRYRSLLNLQSLHRSNRNGLHLNLLQGRRRDNSMAR